MFCEISYPSSGQNNAQPTWCFRLKTLLIRTSISPYPLYFIFKFLELIWAAIKVLSLSDLSKCNIIRSIFKLTLKTTILPADNVKLLRSAAHNNFHFLLTLLTPSIGYGKKHFNTSPFYRKDHKFDIPHCPGVRKILWRTQVIN